MAVIGTSDVLTLDDIKNCDSNHKLMKYFNKTKDDYFKNFKDELVMRYNAGYSFVRYTLKFDKFNFSDAHDLGKMYTKYFRKKLSDEFAVRCGFGNFPKPNDYAIYIHVEWNLNPQCCNILF